MGERRNHSRDTGGEPQSQKVSEGSWECDKITERVQRNQIGRAREEEWPQLRPVAAVEPSGDILWIKKPYPHMDFVFLIWIMLVILVIFAGQSPKYWLFRRVFFIDHGTFRNVFSIGVVFQ